MFRVFAFIRRYSFLLIIGWMALYAFDLIDDLRYNYVNRPSSEVAWMLVSDFLRCLLVIAIWIASNYNSEKEEKIT